MGTIPALKKKWWEKERGGGTCQVQPSIKNTCKMIQGSRQRFKAVGAKYEIARIQGRR